MYTPLATFSFFLSFISTPQPNPALLVLLIHSDHKQRIQILYYIHPQQKQKKKKKKMSSQPTTITHIPLAPKIYVPPAPPTGEKCTEPTPDEQYATLRANLRAAQQQEAEAQSSAPAQPANNADTGYMASIAEQINQMRELAGKVFRNAQNSVSAVSTETEAQVRDLQVKVSAQIFRMSFPDLANSGEVFIASFPCSAVHQDKVLDGTLIVTRNYLCFCSSPSNVMLHSAKDRVLGNRFNSITPSGTVVVAAIPLSKVLSVVPSLALEMKDVEALPLFVNLPNVDVRPTCLQVYDNENQLYQFLNFHGIGAKVESIIYKHMKGAPIEIAYNYIDHAWREIVSL